jgi:hypothetical protein
VWVCAGAVILLLKISSGLGVSVRREAWVCGCMRVMVGAALTEFSGNSWDDMQFRWMG